MDIKERMVLSLKNDCDVLLNTKIPMALKNISDEKGVNTYRNLTRALADNIKLIEELEKDDYKPMWSIYETGANKENLTPQVAVWMQNGKGEISNHQVFDIDYGIKADIITNGVLNVGFNKTYISTDKRNDFEINLITDNKILNLGENVMINGEDYAVIATAKTSEKFKHYLIPADEFKEGYDKHYK